MSNNAPQRTYRAPCPGCGAPVEFRSAQSTHAICAYCHSSVVRDGDTLSRIAGRFLGDIYLFHALARYNGSPGSRDYPDLVVTRWTRYWNGADDLGRPALKPS